MNIYEHIDLAKKYDGKMGIVESVQAQQPDKTATALEVAKRLAESKPHEDKPVQLGALPLPN